jgi:hypothetical protein
MRLILHTLNLIIFTLLLATVSITTPYIYSKIANVPVYTHPEFIPYMDQFKKDAKKYKVKIDLFKLVTVFSDKVKMGIAAYCLPHSKVVVVSTKSWEGLNAAGKKALLYHEWGHCILRREHVEERSFPTYCPVSIMYPYVDPMNRCYNSLKESYNRELFTNPHNFKLFSRRKK